MLRSSTRASRIFVGAALVLSLSLLGVVPALAGDDENDPWDPAMSTSDSMDDHHAESGDPDSHAVESEDLDDTLGHSEDPDDVLGESENPDEMVAETEIPDSHRGGSQNLQDLSTAAPDDGYEAIVPASQANWGPTDDPKVLVARDKVVRAEERAKRARDHYGRMMRANYPRGDARVRIVNERDESEAALEEALNELQALDGGS